MTVKKIFGFGVKVFLALVVLAFLGLQSLNFFSFVFPPEQWYYAYLGFGLTSGAVIAYLVIFSTDSDTPLRKAVAIGMLVVSVIGELLTAGFGMQLEAWKRTGFQLAQSDYDFMVIAVQLLGFAHAIAMILYFAGDKIIEALGDADGDGIPNFIDPDYKAWKQRKNQQNNNHNQSRHNPQPVPLNQEAPRVELPVADPTPGANRNNNSRQ